MSTNDDRLLLTTSMLRAGTAAEASEDAAYRVGFERHDEGDAYWDSKNVTDNGDPLYGGERIYEDWGTGDYVTNRGYNTNFDWMKNHARISGEEFHSGSRSLEITYTSHDERKPSAQNPEGYTGLSIRADLPPSDEYYLSYWVKFGGDGETFAWNGHDNDDEGNGGKLPGLALKPDGSGYPGGGVTSAPEGFSARYMWGKDGEARLYLYHPGMDIREGLDDDGNPLKTYGETFKFGDPEGATDPDNFEYFESDTWHHLVQRVKLNEVGDENGEIEVWMDGEQMLDLTGLELTTTDTQINKAMLDSFFGGNRDWFPEKNQRAFFDDFVISTNPADVGLPPDDTGLL